MPGKIGCQTANTLPFASLVTWFDASPVSPEMFSKSKYNFVIDRCDDMCFTAQKDRDNRIKLTDVDCGARAPTVCINTSMPTNDGKFICRRFSVKWSRFSWFARSRLSVRGCLMMMLQCNRRLCTFLSKSAMDLSDMPAHASSSYSSLIALILNIWRHYLCAFVCASMKLARWKRFSRQVWFFIGCLGVCAFVACATKFPNSLQLNFRSIDSFTDFMNSQLNSSLILAVNEAVCNLCCPKLLQRDSIIEYLWSHHIPYSMILTPLNVQ